PVPRCLAFDPERLARARPIDSATLGNGPRYRFPRAPDKAQRMASLVADHGRPDVARQRLRERRGDGLAERKCAGVEGQTDLAVGAGTIELGYFGRSGYPTCGNDPRALGRAHNGLDRRAVETSHPAFFFHLREQEASDDRRERATAFEY